jgi:hypothetical protein
MLPVPLTVRVNCKSDYAIKTLLKSSLVNLRAFSTIPVSAAAPVASRGIAGRLAVVLRGRRKNVAEKPVPNAVCQELYPLVCPFTPSQQRSTRRNIRKNGAYLSIFVVLRMVGGYVVILSPLKHFQ